MYFRLGQFVARRRWLIVFAWFALAIGVRAVAPDWERVTYDGDMAYLPERSSSVIGERLLDEAFPHDHARSSLVVVLSRREGPLTEPDIHAAYDLARRLKCLHGAAAFSRLLRFESEAASARAAGDAAGADTLDERADLARGEAREALDEAAFLDRSLVAFRRETPGAPPTRMLAEIYWNRAILLAHLDERGAAERDRNRATAISPELADAPERCLPAGAGELPIIDVWTWRDPLFGGKLISEDRRARLISVRVANEFLAMGNQDLLDRVADEIDAVRDTLDDEQRSALSLDVSGSTAVGGDMLRAAKESIDDTERFTVLLIIVILGSVYRAPALVLLPLASIGVSLVVSTGLVAWLADRPFEPHAFWSFKVFTTTRVFIVTILFGAGTDFCLFLIARYREELARAADIPRAMAATLGGVGDAIAASALTTIVGLAMMGFSEFGKFRYSGPVIGLCLFVTTIVCLTLTPALLAIIGRRVDWPFAPRVYRGESARVPSGAGIWRFVAECVTRRPGLVLVSGLLLMAPLAARGVVAADHVTYDIVRGLGASRPSRVGAETMRRHFPVGESGPLTLVMHRPGADFESEQGRAKVGGWVRELYAVDGVESVRSIVDPLGAFPPGRTIGLAGEEDRMLWVARPHRKTSAVFIAGTSRFPRDLTRIDVVLRDDPFSRAALDTLERIEAMWNAHARDPGSFWNGCPPAFAGSTASVRDLRDVTLEDRKRIERLVVIAVYLVLVAILRKPVISLYLIASVLLTYLVTIGATELFFRRAYGEDYVGLDWRVPLYLFVILVAIGQDYNVYLVTRVDEEQKRIGLIPGLRWAVVQTGGIITSCGIIMAGTFIAMTSAAWGGAVPDRLSWLRERLGADGGLRAIVELGFALALGVLIDTFLVRTLLVPAFLTLACRFRRARGLSGRSATGEPDPGPPSHARIAPTEPPR
ncbi:MAG: MMPL family transporter [Planctomycetes bacterium]|nr:MMPL family transporter [Planctomycetota bacterium]